MIKIKGGSGREWFGSFTVRNEGRLTCYWAYNGIGWFFSCARVKMKSFIEFFFVWFFFNGPPYFLCELNTFISVKDFILCFSITWSNKQHKDFILCLVFFLFILVSLSKYFFYILVLKEETILMPTQMRKINNFKSDNLNMNGCKEIWNLNYFEMTLKILKIT